MTLPADLTNPTRRTALTALAAAPLAAALPGCATTGAAGPAPGPDASLNTLAQLSGRRFGSVVSSFPGRTEGPSIENPRHAALVLKECGVVVPENQLKWQSVRPAADRFDFAAMDRIAAWAKTNNLALRGHTLLWHRTQWFPKWLNDYDFGANPRAEAERLLTEHIRTVTARYKGLIHSYDVVNETIDHDRNAPIETSMSRAMGSATAPVDLAFHLAREAAPGVELVYNDYMSWEPQHKKHCADVLRLLEGFRKRGVPVDTLGIQSHIENFEVDPATGYGPIAEKEWRAFLDEVVGMGYKLIITEFDVKDKALPTDIAVRDAKVAEFTKRYFDLMLSYPQMGDVLAWGLVDRYSWLQGFAPREDKLEVRASPYSSDYQPKPMREAIGQSFRAAPLKKA